MSLELSFFRNCEAVVSEVRGSKFAAYRTNKICQITAPFKLVVRFALLDSYHIACIRTNDQGRCAERKNVGLSGALLNTKATGVTAGNGILEWIQFINRLISDGFMVL